MTRFVLILNAALWSILAATVPLSAQEANLDDLYELLRSDGLEDYEAVETKIQEEWSKSGSPSMDLLLERGVAALEAGDTEAAIEHLTALTDHAPDFAEGWSTLATAYFAEGLYGPAVDGLEHALVLNPRHFDALSGLGIIFREVGLKRQALAAFRAAHELTPHRVELIDAIHELEVEVEGSLL